MTLFDQLKDNKGTVSMAFGKEIAAKILSGQKELLSEAAEFVTYELEELKAKNIRAGAAKIIELVAMENPELAAPFGDNLLAALVAPEPQTRWVSIRTLGYCASFATEAALKALPYAKKFLKRKEGICLSGAVTRYLGDLGAVSKETAKKVFPLLEKAVPEADQNEIDWILEGFTAMVVNLTPKQKGFVYQTAKENLEAMKKSTVKRAKGLMKKIEKEK